MRLEDFDNDEDKITRSIEAENMEWDTYKRQLGDF
jgi:hypothetical protein